MCKAITDLTIVTEEDIDYLISCPKLVTTQRRKTPKKFGNNYVSDTSLASLDNKYTFQFLIRVHADFPSNFSVILKLLVPNGDDAILLRCNGPHDNFYIAQPSHARPHIHKLSASEWNSKARKNPKGVRQEASYTNITEALQYFRDICSISGDDRFFNFSFPEDNESVNDSQVDIIGSRQMELDDL